MKERKILIAAILAATVFCVSVMPVVQRWWKKDAGVEARGQEEEDKGEIQLFSFPTLNLNIEKNRAKELGSAENPFIVLEIVPFEVEAIVKRHRLLYEMDADTLSAYDDMSLNDVDYVIL